MADYKDAGVDISEDSRFIQRITQKIQSRWSSRVLNTLEDFAIVLDMGDTYMAVGVDGVGSKVQVAVQAGVYDTVGIDLVAMCANDVLCTGARPSFFLDCLSKAKLETALLESIIDGVLTGCDEAGCLLVGGETASLPDLYASPSFFELSGTCIGEMRKEDWVQGKRRITEGDIVLGLPSSGLHSNGYTLVRRLFFDTWKMKMEEHVPDFGMTLGEELLRPTRIYTKELEVVRAEAHGVAHLTGGGFYENIPRILPDGLGVQIRKGWWPKPTVFRYLQERGQLSGEEMYRTFNMGIGMVIVVGKESPAHTLLKKASLPAHRIGEVVKGAGVTFL